MPGRPHLVDNLGAETAHASAIRYLAADLGTGHPLSVATGFVNLGGLSHLAAAVRDGRHVRLLLGAVPEAGLGAQLPLTRFELALRLLSQERDLSRFPPSRAASRLAEIAEWLDQGTLEVRRYTSTFLHGKAYLFGTAEDGRAALVTSANLTGAGLSAFANLELGLVDYSANTTRDALAWFDARWADAEEYTDALRALLFPDVEVLDPQTIYLRALLELYRDELEVPLPPSVATSVRLAPFQQQGYDRARRILDRHHGVVYADGVGTGKTEIGLAFIEEYAVRKGQHALVIAPAQLARTWESRISQARLPAQVVSFQQLAADEQLAPDARLPRRVLHNAADTYRLVVVDEAHALRNPDTTWYRAMARLLGGEQKKLVLLTATPVNNGLWDLYHLVLAFARHDRAFASIGIPSARELFIRAGANERDPEQLDPDVLFPLADAVSVRRDRRFIQETYPDATFADGTRVRFPEPDPVTERYDLDAAAPGLAADVAALIATLSMARYRPSAYEWESEEDPRETSLSGLLQSGVLKRFESCWAACLATVERMVAAHRLFLESWDAGVVPVGAALRAAVLAEAGDTGLAETALERLLDDPDSRPVEEFRPEYRDAVDTDLAGLVRIRDRLAELDAASDPKLARLVELLDDLPAEKIAVFATYGETIAYLDTHLPDRVGGRERIVVIGGETDPDQRTAALARFCPATVVRPDYVPPDGEVDLLLSTDVLSEGQNLQQAAAVISYDMPWNPQRVVQRNGRVIRLRSPHDRVTLVTMLPQPGELDELLRLEATIRRKILAASVYGMESDVLDGVESQLRSYASRLAEGDSTLLEGDDGEAGALGGEQLRALLQRAAEEGELARLDALPWGVSAAFRMEDAGSPGPPGIFFACRTSSGHRYWRYVEADGTVVDAEAAILRRIDPQAAPGIDVDDLPLEDAWRAAVQSIVAEHNRRADPREAQRSIGPAQRFALELLRDPAVEPPPGAEQADEALSVERGTAVRTALTDIRRLTSDGSITGDEAARRVVSIVQDFGLRAVKEEQLEPITDEDVGVVCWMAVLG